MIKGGLAWLLRQGGVVGDVVDHRGINIVGVYWKEVMGREPINNREIKAPQT